MIIQCDKCATRFRLDDSRITGKGVKVRCTKCQNVFVVTPAPPVEEVQLEEVFGAGSGPARARSGRAEGSPRDAAAGQGRKNLAFDFEDEAPSSGPAAPDAPEGGGNGEAEEPEQPEPPRKESPAGEEHDDKPILGDMDFSFSEDRSGDKDEPAGQQWAGAEDNGSDFNFDFGDPAEPPAPAAHEGEEKEELDFSFDDEPDAGAGGQPSGSLLTGNEPEDKPAAAAPSGKVIQFASAGYSKDGKPAAPAEPAAPSAPAAPVSTDAPPKQQPAAHGKGDGEGEFKDILSHSLSREDLPDFGGPEDDEAPAGRPMAAAGQRPGRTGLLVAALIVVLGGGLIYFTGVIDMLARVLMPPSQSQLKVIEIETINGFYAANSNFGKFFVIQARVKNITDEPQEVKAATGIIYGKDGGKLDSRSVSPGRIVSIEDVRALSKDELARAFKDPSGGVIPPKGTVPVMVLFTETSDGVAEYGLDIVR